MWHRCLRKNILNYVILFFFSSITRLIYSKAGSLVYWNSTKKKSLSIHCFQNFLFISGVPQSTQLVMESHLLSWVPVSAPESLQPDSCILVPFYEDQKQEPDPLKTNKAIGIDYNRRGGTLSKNGWEPKLCT